MVGKTISHYKILSKLGEGGMGVVYKAEDTKLERTVALKFLSLASIGDEEKKRFKREAKAAASLNHPNIATVFAIDEADDQTFIAMEYIEGKSLQDIVGANGGSPMKINDAIDYATQTAAGLQAAHEKGITHRDIKSANIMVTKKGQIKIMDFGLAKLANRSMMTKVGTTLGTTSYMSPEQSRGENTDHRSDIWSLGVVLYEMISGQMPFKGDYEQAVIYSIQNEEPQPLTALRSGVPIALDGIIAKALAKDAGIRYQNVEELPADFKALGNVTKISSGMARSGSAIYPGTMSKFRLPRWLISAVSVTLGGLLMFFAVSKFDNGDQVISQEAKEPKKFVIDLPTDHELAFARSLPLGLGQPAIAISPEGTKIVYVVRGAGTTHLHLRSLDAWESNPIPGTEDGHHPFFSPDGAWVGFLTNNKVKKVALEGGEPITLCDIRGNAFGATWSEDGWIYFAGEQGRKLSRVRVTGGPPEEVMDRRCTWPQALPGGKAVLCWSGGGRENQDYGRTFVYNVESNENKLVFEGGAMARYLPTGHLVYGRGGALYAVPFDLDRTKTTGSPALILQGVRTEASRGAVQFTFSLDGTLVYVAGPNRDVTELVWVDRMGLTMPLGLPLQVYGEFKISPDGRYLAVAFRGEKADIRIFEFSRDTWLRLTVEGSNYFPVWSPDGTQITFSSNRDGTWSVYRKNVDGSGDVERLTQAKEGLLHSPFCWSPDGRFLLFVAYEEGKRTVWLLENEDPTRPYLYNEKANDMAFLSISPNGRWLAYTSDELGPSEVFVDHFPSPKKRSKVSLDGGEEPRWSPDGKELYYRNRDQWFAVPINPESGSMADKPRVLFEGPYINVSGFSWDIHPDGKRFLVLREQRQKNPRQLRLVQNWFDEVKNKVQERNN